MVAEKTAILKVMEADPNLVGKKVAALDNETRQHLGLSHEDCILIKGKKDALAKIWPGRPSDEGESLIRIDSFTRKNAGVAIGDTVIVKKASLQTAKKVTFAPIQEIHTKLGQYTRMVKKTFLSKPMINGEEVMFAVFGNPICLIVQSTKPKGPVLISDETEVEVLNDPVDPNTANVSRVSYEDIGGIKKQLTKIREMIEIPLRHPELFRRLGVEPPKGVLLYGPPGTGKTMVAKAVATESGAHIITIKGPEIMSRYVGGAEQKIRELFKEAQDNAPSIIFIDEIDAIAPIREEVAGDVEKRVVAQLLSLMDGMEARGDVIVIAATNRPNSVDMALRRPGRFDREVEIGPPDREGRKEILEIMTRSMPMDRDIDLDKIVSQTHGFVGADISALVKEAAMQTIRRVLPDLNLSSEELPLEELEKITLEKEDFEKALQEVNPSALREVFVEVPNVRWEDVGGLDTIKNDLKKMVEWPLKYNESFDKAGILPIKGILLYGPPGTGKTMLAKAIANECEANFISIRGPEIFNKWLGESEKKIRDIFQKAKQTSPCIVFFDEIDAICPRRPNDTNQTTYRVVNQLLAEIDGMSSSKGVVFLAATNKLYNVDTALMRPGRVDMLLFVDNPDEKGRLDILRKLSKNMQLKTPTDLEIVAKDTNEYSGADLNAVLREAAFIALEKGDMKPTAITLDDFKEAIIKTNEYKTKTEKEDKNTDDTNYIR